MLSMEIILTYGEEIMNKIKEGTKCFKAKIDTQVSIHLKYKMDELQIPLNVQKQLLEAVDTGINVTMYEMEDEPQGIEIYYEGECINNSNGIFSNPENYYKRSDYLKKKLGL